MSHQSPNSGLLSFLLQLSSGTGASPALGLLGPTKPAFSGESNMLQQMLCNAMTASQLTPQSLFGGPLTSPIFGHHAQPATAAGLLDRARLGQTTDFLST